jgi:hypothetical protein
MVKFDVVAVAPFASVTLTDTAEPPTTVGVPEIVPVEASMLRPFTNVPFSAYVRGARPPAPGTARENALSPVLSIPVVGVAIVRLVATVTVKFDVVAVAPFASVTVTDTVRVAVLVGVPEIVPVEALMFKEFHDPPLLHVYVSGARPPAPETVSEKARFAVVNNPVVGVAIVKAPETVRVAADEVVDDETPELKVFVTTTV